MQVCELDSAISHELLRAWSLFIEDEFTEHCADRDMFPALHPYLRTPASDAQAERPLARRSALLLCAAAGAVLLFTMACMAVCDRVFARTSLAAIGTLAVLLGVGAGYGIAMAIGIPYTAPALVLPFALLALGAANVHSLVHSLEAAGEAAPGATLEERMRRCLAATGPPHTAVMLCTVAAFLCTSISSAPALRWFGWYGAIAVFKGAHLALVRTPAAQSCCGDVYRAFQMQHLCCA